jgi:hypothetical protein
MNIARTKFHLLCLLALTACVSYGQKKSNGSLYAEFAKTFQAKNLGLNNGKIHFNSYRSIDKTHRYFGPDQYRIGQVYFDGQPYLNVYFKYDLLNDELVVKLDGEANQLGFNPVKEKISSFYINELKFVNLDLDISHPEFIKGFYEQTNVGDDLTLYTKHYKDRFEVLTKDVVLNKYVEKNTFILKYKDSWHEVSSEKDAARAFPDFQNKIADFFKTNAPLEKSDRKQFMKTFVAYLNNLLQTPSN